MRKIPCLAGAALVILSIAPTSAHADDWIKNVVARIVERELVLRHPRRDKLIRTIGWIERISFAVSLASIQSASHFHQWRQNERLARELGYR